MQFRSPANNRKLVSPSVIPFDETAEDSNQDDTGCLIASSVCSGTSNPSRNRFEQVVVSFELLPEDKDIACSSQPQFNRVATPVFSKQIALAKVRELQFDSIAETDEGHIPGDGHEDDDFVSTSEVAYHKQGDSAFNRKTMLRKRSAAKAR
jgi:hypothetical protein